MKRFFKRGLAAFLAVSMFMTSSGMTSLAAEVAEHVTNSEVTESGTTEVHSEATEETSGGGVRKDLR